MDEILTKANKILATGSVDDICEFLPEIMAIYDELDIKAVRQEKSHDDYKDTSYIGYREDKVNTKMTDNEMQTRARMVARELYGDFKEYKVVIKHIEKYIELLNSKMIELQGDDKKKRDMVGY